MLALVAIFLWNDYKNLQLTLDDTDHSIADNAIDDFLIKNDVDHDDHQTKELAQLILTSRGPFRFHDSEKPTHHVFLRQVSAFKFFQQQFETNQNDKNKAIIESIISKWHPQFTMEFLVRAELHATYQKHANDPIELSQLDQTAATCIENDIKSYYHSCENPLITFQVLYDGGTVSNIKSKNILSYWYYSRFYCNKNKHLLEPMRQTAQRHDWSTVEKLNDKLAADHSAKNFENDPHFEVHIGWITSALSQMLAILRQHKPNSF